MKKLLSLLLVLSLLIAPVAVVGAAGPAMLISASPVNLMVDGEKITADQGAVYDAKMDTYMLPLRAVAEAIGADITKVDVYGQPLFFPNSNEWHALQLEQAS